MGLVSGSRLQTVDADLVDKIGKYYNRHLLLHMGRMSLSLRRGLHSKRMVSVRSERTVSIAAEHCRLEGLSDLMRGWW